MNWKEFITGIVLYYLPITIFIVSIFIIPNALWVAISVTWIFTSMFYKLITLPDAKGRNGQYKFRN
jgi:sensor histidine kinase YesM